MKVYFDNVNFSSSTGPNSFARRLATELIENFGIEIVGHQDHYDVFLCFIEPTHKPRPSAKFIQRLDGIWFKPEQFETHNKLIKWAYDNCHHVVWQSLFDKKMTLKWWGERPGSVIRNGIKIQKPPVKAEFAEWRKQHDKLYVCSASWHRQKRLKENIELFRQISSAQDALIVLGSSPDHIVTDSNIFYFGNLSHEECLGIYDSSDWMIHLAWLDHCPNVVVEAISQNCPVICTDSGGTAEIVKQNGIVIQELHPYNFELCDYDDPPPLELSGFKSRDIKIDNSYLKIENVARKYYNVFKG